jgi:hypothetical protein
VARIEHPSHCQNKELSGRKCRFSTAKGGYIGEVGLSPEFWAEIADIPCISTRHA